MIFLLTGYVGINSFGFGGANVHVLLKSPEDLLARKRVENNVSELKIPYLICVSGRTKSAVDMLLDGIHQESSIIYPKPANTGDEINLDVVQLVQAAFKNGVEGHDYRGFVVLDKRGYEISRSDAMIDNVSKKETVFLFSGYDYNPTLARGLLVFPVFQEVIERSNKFLAKFSIQLLKMVEDVDFGASRNFVEKHVASTVVQVGIVQLLKSLKVEPTVIIGQGAGEILCAFTDGCLTLEQTLTAAYLR